MKHVQTRRLAACMGVVAQGAEPAPGHQET
jgi:hypothetical protein